MHSSLILQLLVLRKALSLCGSEEALGHRLDVSRRELRGWLTASETVPLSVFNRAMHLVNRAYREAAKNRAPVH